MYTLAILINRPNIGQYWCLLNLFHLLLAFNHNKPIILHTSDKRPLPHTHTHHEWWKLFIWYANDVKSPKTLLINTHLSFIILKASGYERVHICPSGPPSIFQTANSWELNRVYIKRCPTKGVQWLHFTRTKKNMYRAVAYPLMTRVPLPFTITAQFMNQNPLSMLWCLAQRLTKSHSSVSTNNSSLESVHGVFVCLQHD